MINISKFELKFFIQMIWYKIVRKYTVNYFQTRHCFQNEEVRSLLECPNKCSFFRTLDSIKVHFGDLTPGTHFKTIPTPPNIVIVISRLLVNYCSLLNDHFWLAKSKILLAFHQLYYCYYPQSVLWWYSTHPTLRALCMVLLLPS